MFLNLVYKPHTSICILRLNQHDLQKIPKNKGLFITNYQGMKNYFLSHLPKGKWNKKNYFPFQISTFLLRPGSKSNCLGGLGACPLLEIFEIINANSAFWAYLKGYWCLKINVFFLLCFVVYNQFEIWSACHFPVFLYPFNRKWEFSCTDYSYIQTYHLKSNLVTYVRL